MHLSVVKALAMAIEAKDNTTPEQVERIQVYSEGLARALAMSEPEVQAVKTAALLHDIGNLAVPDHILSKPGRLTYDEYELLKKHPRVGADIIGQVPFPYPVAPLVLSHHERWDGRGYPAGLRGEDIPLGARIISVVDCFTSMLTERPYRPSHTYAEAIATLRENGGSTLDPASSRSSSRSCRPSRPSCIRRLARGEGRRGGAWRRGSAATGAGRHRRGAARGADAARDGASRSARRSRCRTRSRSSRRKLVSDDAARRLRAVPASSRRRNSSCARTWWARNQDAIRAVTASTLEGLGAALPTIRRAIGAGRAGPRCSP